MSHVAASRTAYTRGASIFHWCVAIPLLGSVASVLYAQQAPKEEKGTWMFRHKSLGLLTGLVVAPRLVYRLVNYTQYNLQALPGSPAWEQMAGSIGHYALYAFMTIMPATGIAMGYYGGKGLPFFYTTLSGAETANGAIAKQAFSIHKTLGTYGKFLLPIHVGAAGFHTVKGQKIFSRINPFGAKP
jgi:cytochrome b561